MKNKNLRRLLAVFLCLVMVLSLLTACSKDDDDDEDEDDEKTSQTDKQKDDKDSDKDEDKDSDKDEDKDSDKDEDKDSDKDEDEDKPKPTKAPETKPTKAPTKAPETKPTKAPTKATKPAASEPEPETSVNTDSETTAKYSGVTVTKLPYTNNGLTIESISFGDYDEVIVLVTNNTGAPIASYSSICYECYDADGTLLNSSDTYLEDLNDGETAQVYFYATTDTAKILFGEADIFEGTKTVKPSSTAVYSGITANKLPYTDNDLTIESISFGDYDEAIVHITNNTGNAITGYSNFTYKCYNADGIVLASSEIFLEDLNDGETCETTFYLPEDVSEIFFFTAQTYEGTKTVAPSSTSVYSGVTVNKLPYTNKGLTIESISFGDYGEVFFLVTNNTGAPIGGSSNFRYKCYDADGIVLDSSEMYLEELNDGETAQVWFYAPDNTTKIFFGETIIQDGIEIDEPTTTVSGGIVTNVVPYTSNGVTIDEISFDDYGEVIFSFTNNTGAHMASYSSFTYKCYNADGIVVDSGDAYLADLDNGESAEDFFYIDDDATKVIFLEATVEH